MIEQGGKVKYRVDVGGKITVYNHILVHKSKEYVEQTFESHLVLEEVGKISKAEMTMWKNKFSQNKKDINAAMLDLMVRV